MCRFTWTTKGHVQFAADASWSLGQNQNTIRKLSSFLDIMGDEHNRPRKFFQHARQLSSHTKSGKIVERRERFVQKEDVCISSQSTCQLNALSHAPGELMWIMSCKFYEIDQSQHFIELSFALVLAAQFA